MKRISRILVGTGCLVILTVSWVITVSAKSTAQMQQILIEKADKLIEDGIYIRAVPLLEEAAGLNATYTQLAEEELKKTYLKLIKTSGISRKYTSLLDIQMNRKNASPEVFAEAAGYYMSISRVNEALNVLKKGIRKTGGDVLIEMYESSRYKYETSRTSYDYVAEPFGTTVQVQTGGLWGIAGADGVILIPCEYEKISTFSVDRAVVMKNGEIYAVDRNNNRVDKLYEKASGFGNLANDRIPILIDGQWLRAFGDLSLGAIRFQELGMYSEGYVAARTGEKWGVVNISSTWLIPAEYDGVILDGLGRCYAQGAVFIRSGGTIYLFSNGNLSGTPYEDARPFYAEGYAAVKNNGKWGYIDVNGNVMIEFKFDDALSFSKHLAAVKQDGLWGYISLAGHIVIEPSFIEARSFSDGCAPVLTERGWQIISLLEYKRGPSL